MLEDVVGYALLLAIVLIIIGSTISNYRRRKSHPEPIATPAFGAFQDLSKHDE